MGKSYPLGIVPVNNMGMPNGIGGVGEFFLCTLSIWTRLSNKGLGLVSTLSAQGPLGKLD